ncbi:MAG: glycine oxidase maturase GoxB [Pseudomonadota bacterium]
MIHPAAVLGGGIAGAAAALRLAQAGLRPVWIAPPRGEIFKPGEHLSAAAIPLLKALGSDALLRAEVHRLAHSTYSAWGSDTLVARDAILQLDGPPIVLDRAAFENALSAQAMAAGAERIEGSVAGLRIDGSHWCLETDVGAVQAAFLFDATGRKALVSSRFAPRFSADRLGCQYAVFSRSGAEPPRPVTLIEAEARGWWYLSALTDGRAVVNFYTDTDLPAFDNAALAEQACARPALGAYLTEYGFGQCGDVRRIATNSTWIAPAIGEGWVAIGDASAAFDPLSSHGMTTALWSAIQAADAFVARDRAAMQTYADSVAKGVRDYLSARRDVYQRESRWPDSRFWARRHGEIEAEPAA